MWLVVLKFVEIFGRAGFVVGASYSLSLQEAGQFGLVVTLVSLFATAFNWERHVDLSRRFAGVAKPEFDRAIDRAAIFWGVNQLLMLPAFVVLLVALSRLSGPAVLLASVIVVAEHVCNVVYTTALARPAYRPALLLVAAKNLAVLAWLAPAFFGAPGELTLYQVLATWAIGQGVCAILVIGSWIAVRTPAAQEVPFSFRKDVLSQHRASLTHFAIGLLAALVLQVDRLVVGALLGLDDTGRYFRHILLISMVYQFFNVASYNRILPRVFAMARTEAIAPVLRVVRRELAMVAGAVAVGAAAALGLDAATGGAIAARYHLSVSLALILLAGALLRIAADFLSLLCNARHREATILRNQLVSFGTGLICMVGLTAAFGIVGTAIATVVSAGVYLLLTTVSVLSLPQQPMTASAQPEAI